MITCSSIAFEDFLGSSIVPQVMPPWYQDQLVKACMCAGSSSKLCVSWWLTGWVLTEVHRRSPGTQPGRQIWQIFPISGSLSRTLSTPWERRPMTCTLHSYKTKTQDKDTGTFWFWPFCSNHVGGRGTRIMIYITCYSSKRKGLNRKMGIWYRIQIPIYFAEKDHVHSLYTVHVQNNRSRGKMGGNFKPMFI